MTDLEKSNRQRVLMRLPPLMTREDFDKLSPRTQGYVS